ncbi:MAG TPA: hypothetical protein VFO86_03885 [Terriglobia bacterium]|nr:hypothetical protein [Terriglobia bacterium]
MDTKLEENTKLSVDLQQPVRGREMTRIQFVPVDKSGSPLGPGLIDALLITTHGDVRIESRRDTDAVARMKFSRAGPTRRAPPPSQSARPAVPKTPSASS